MRRWWFIQLQQGKERLDQMYIDRFPQEEGFMPVLSPYLVSTRAHTYECMHTHARAHMHTHI